MLTLKGGGETTPPPPYIDSELYNQFISIFFIFFFQMRTKKVGGMIVADYNKEEWEKFNRQFLEGQFASYVECPLTRRCKWLYSYVKSMEE